MSHTSTMQATWAGYSFRCSCGYPARTWATLARARAEHQRHLYAAAHGAYWYVVVDGVPSRPYESKREALASVGTTTSTKVSPGTYAAPCHALVTNNLEELLCHR